MGSTIVTDDFTILLHSLLHTPMRLDEGFTRVPGVSC